MRRKKRLDFKLCYREVEAEDKAIYLKLNQLRKKRKEMMKIHLVLMIQAHLEQIVT